MNEEWIRNEKDGQRSGKQADAILDFRSFFAVHWLLLVLWAKQSEWAAEYLFARGLTRILTVPLTFITNLVPFSVAEILLYCLILMIPIGLLVCCIRPRLKKWKRYGALLLCLVFWGFFLFQTLFVIQFGRRSLEAMLDYDTEDITAQELYQTAMPLLAQANKLCDCIYYTEEGDSRYQEGMSREAGNRALLRHSYSGFSAVQDSMGLPLGGINALAEGCFGFDWHVLRGDYRHLHTLYR
ncbi:MAG: DUF3810 family protein [Clostridia bacterium]